MRTSSYLMIPIFTIMAALLLPVNALANTINLHDAPQDNSKVTGTIDLASGIIPIYTPQNSQWIKVADPRNGNTGWVKNSELKDSHGNAITFSQRISDNGNASSQSMQMNVGQPVTPEQQAIIDQQQKATAESIVKAQQSVGQALEAVKQAYQQQMQIMQSAGFPKGPMPVTGVPPLPSGGTATPVGNAPASRMQGQ